MALNRPFVYATSTPVGANSTATASFLVGVGETFDLYKIFTDGAHNGVNIIQVRDSTGLQYVVASTSQPIPVAELVYPGKANPTNLFEFVDKLVLVGQVQFLVDLNNTTATADTVQLFFVGYKHVAGS